VVHLLRNPWPTSVGIRKKPAPSVPIRGLRRAEPILDRERDVTPCSVIARATPPNVIYDFDVPRQTFFGFDPPVREVEFYYANFPGVVRS